MTDSSSALPPNSTLSLSISGLSSLPLGAPATAETLLGFGVFADLDESERERLLSQMHPLTVPARAILLAAGQPGHVIYFLLEGSVAITLERPTGPRTQPAFSIGKKQPKAAVAVAPEAGAPETGATASSAQVILNLCGPGSVLGELSAFDGGGHSANVSSRETCRLLWMDKNAFLEAVQAMPPLSLALLRECSVRLRRATQQLHAYSTLDAAGRVAHAILLLAERFGTQTPEGLSLDIGLNQIELADLTGMTRTRVNQVMAIFRQSGWLEQEGAGAILLRDVEQLAGVAHRALA